MKTKRTIIIILSLVTLLAFSIQLTRTDYFIRMSTDNLEDLLNVEQGAMDKAAWSVTPKFSIVYDNERPECYKIAKNIEKTLEYMRIDSKLIPTEQFVGFPEKQETLVLVMEDLSKIGTPEKLPQFIKDGGSVYIAFRPGLNTAFYGLYRDFGISEYGDYIDAKGLVFKEDLLVASKGMRFPDESLFLNSSIQLSVDNTCKVLLESVEGCPLMWTKKIGDGHLVYFNGTVSEGKQSRGIIAGAVSYLSDSLIYPIINAKVVDIDDFPAPFPYGEFPSIRKEFNRSIPEFFKQIWWPDMVRIAHNTNVKYTGFVIGTYNAEIRNVQPGTEVLTREDFVYFGRELLKQGGEMGIHGYNHQPFFTTEIEDKTLPYKPYPSKEAMLKSIEEINNFSKMIFPKYTFRCYVPPSNILKPEGREMLAESNTDIKVISSVYSTEGDESGYEQEYEVARDGIVEFPRLSSGYLNKNESRWYNLSGITLHGVFSHFVHPDDLLDEDRSGGKGWTEARKEFEALLHWADKNYPWLRPSTGTEGANALVKYSSSLPTVSKTRGGYIVESPQKYGSCFFYLRTDREVQRTEGLKVKKVDSRTYLIESTGGGKIYLSR